MIMKRNLLHKIFLMTVTVCMMINADAKVWKVSNVTGAGANFTQISLAAENAAVLPGDTLYVEGSTDTYWGLDLKKRLTIIGPGYFLSGANGNAGLQYSGLTSEVTIYIDSLASGTIITGMSGSAYLYSDVDNVTLTRNKFNIYSYGAKAKAKASNIKINKNYGLISAAIVFENLECINNIIVSSCSINSIENINGLFRNNCVDYYNPSISGAYVSNNIFTSSSLTLFNCTTKYNIASGNVLPAGNNNRNSIPAASVYINTGSTDGSYRLLTNSPAKASGEPINGVTPDCGAFGTADPYRLSGIPAIPTIYDLNVPASVPSTASSMTVTISTRSNN